MISLQWTLGKFSRLYLRWCDPHTNRGMQHWRASPNKWLCRQMKQLLPSLCAQGGRTHVWQLAGVSWFNCWKSSRGRHFVLKSGGDIRSDQGRMFHLNFEGIMSVEHLISYILVIFLCTNLWCQCLYVKKPSFALSSLLCLLFWEVTSLNAHVAPYSPQFILYVMFKPTYLCSWD